MAWALMATPLPGLDQSPSEDCAASPQRGWLSVSPARMARRLVDGTRPGWWDGARAPHRTWPRSTVVVRLDSRRATGAPTPWWPPNPGKMWNSSPSATFRSTFPPVSGQNAERNALRAPSILHFPRFPGKMQNSSPAAVFRSTFSPGGGNVRAGGRLPRKHHPRSFRYGPIRPLRDRGGEA